MLLVRKDQNPVRESDIISQMILCIRTYLEVYYTNIRPAKWFVIIKENR